MLFNSSVQSCQNNEMKTHPKRLGFSFVHCVRGDASGTPTRECVEKSTDIKEIEGPATIEIRHRIDEY